MGILGGSGGASNFERLLESATSQLQLEPNWANILELCDSIRQKDVTPKYAVAAMRKKMQDKNPHVVKFALVTLEACMKNCGGPIHDEVATRDFMEELRNLANTGSDPVKQQTLSMVQTWNQTLGKKSNYKIIQDTYNLLKAEGHSFPQLQESEAMYAAETAPEWAEGDVCHQCRVRFSTFTRQHHCRCCGEVFCAKCSSKNSIIPKFGIEREVRVCDACYDSINPSGTIPKTKSSSEDLQYSGNDDLPPEYLNSSLSKEAQTKPQPSEAELKAQEEEELQLAMALSLSAAEVEQQQQPKRNYANTSSSASVQSSSPASSLYSKPRSNLYSEVVADSRSVSDSNSGELVRYLNRQYWEKVKDGSQAEPSAPTVQYDDDASSANVYEGDADESTDEVIGDSVAFVETMSKCIKMFINRMQNVTSKGKHIAMDSTVQSLFQSLSAMHPQLMKLIEDEEDNKAKYQAMLEKIALVREARESLDGMRNQHREKLRQQELEQEMLRRMQMEQKLELMRQQKQEYLEYQHQLQIQRQQELEAQQQIKFQQKQMQFQGAYGNRQFPMQAPMGQEAFIPTSQYQSAQTLPQGQPIQGSQMQYSGQYPQTSGSYSSWTEASTSPQNQPMASQAMTVGPNPVTSVQSQMPQQQQQLQQPQQPQQQQQQQQFDSQQYRQPLSQEQGPMRNAPPQGQPIQQQFPQQQIPMQQPTQQHQQQQGPPQQHAPAQQQVTPQHQPSQPTQQPTQYPSPMPDLLDAPIGTEIGMHGQEPRSQAYAYKQPQQQYPHPQQQQQQQQQQQPPQVSQAHQQQQHQQQLMASQQQQLPNQQQQFVPSSQQQPQSVAYQQNLAQPSMQQQQQQPYYQPASTGQASFSGQSTQQAYQQSPNRGQTQGQFAGGQDHYQAQANLPSHLTQAAHQQGPASLPYIRQDALNSQMQGPASLPSSMNQYPGGGQGVVNNQPYLPQNGYQQQPNQQPEMQMTESMKDLQLISFE